MTLKGNVPTVKARTVRCWGPKRPDNNYYGTNITILNGSELVTISQGDNGTLRIHEFSKAQNTRLGEKVKEIFEAEGLTIEIEEKL